MTLFRIIICFLLFNKINAGEILSDLEYYNKGVSLYDEGAFDESFIVFFNLAEKVITTQFSMYQICIMKVLEQFKILNYH